MANQFLCVAAALILSQKYILSVSATTGSLLRRRHNDNDTNNNNPAIATTRKLDTRIIGGSEATEDRYSFVVSLQDHIGHFCGGSLIAKDVVLTAAHYQGGSYDVVLGRHD